jgi:hypothetical protein
MAAATGEAIREAYRQLARQIGKDLAGKIRQIVETGHHQQRLSSNS